MKLSAKARASDPGEGVVREWPRLTAMRRNHEVDGLLQELRNPKETYENQVVLTVRERAIIELAKLRELRAVDLIVELLNDPLPSVRTEAAMALGKIGEQSAMPGLITALSDGDDAVRMAAAKSLGRLGDRAAVPKLVAALADENAWVRMAAARSLARVGDRNALVPLREAVRREGWRHPAIRFRLSKAFFSLRSGQ